MTQKSIDWVTFEIISWFDVENNKVDAKSAYNIFDWILDLYYDNWWRTEFRALRKILKHWHEDLDITDLIQKFTVIALAYNEKWKVIWFIRWFWDWYKTYYIEDAILSSDYRWQWIAQKLMRNLKRYIKRNYVYKSILVASSDRAENYYRWEWFESSKWPLLEFFMR